MELALLCLSALVAGAVNSVAGGGTLLTFPALLSILGNIPNAGVLANATSTVALCPGSVAGIWGYRREYEGMGRWIAYLVGPSLLGGMIGSLLVVLLDPSIFDRLVPWLILTATLLLALQPAIARWTGIGKPHDNPSRLTIAGIMVLQFVIGIYGGYFGAGIGILMLSALAMMGLSDIHRMNGLKSLLAAGINGTSVVIFVYNNVVRWQYALPMMGAAIVGGFLGAHYARKLDKTLVRRIVIAIGFSLAGWFFVKTYYLAPRKTLESTPPVREASQAIGSPAVFRRV